MVFLVGSNSTSGWLTLSLCRFVSQFGHHCYIYFPHELSEDNPALYSFLERVIALPNVTVIEPVNLPIKIDVLICGLFGDFTYKAWFMELQDNINAVNIQHKLIYGFKNY